MFPHGGKDEERKGDYVTFIDMLDYGVSRRDDVCALPRRRKEL